MYQIARQWKVLLESATSAYTIVEARVIRLIGKNSKTDYATCAEYQQKADADSAITLHSQIKMAPETAEAFYNDIWSMRGDENSNTRIKQAVLSETKIESEQRRWTVTRWRGPFVLILNWSEYFMQQSRKTGVFLRERETKRIEQIGFDSCFITVSIL